MTWSPGSFLRDRASPVIMDSSTEVIPSVTKLSTGIFCPGRTNKVIPFFIWLAKTFFSTPSVSTVAFKGLRSIKNSIVLEVFCLALASKYCPSNTRVITTAVASKKGEAVPPGKYDGNVTTITEYAQAEPVPKAISVSIFAFLCLSAFQAPTKNCFPA